MSLQIKQGDVTITLPITDAFTLINISRNNGGFQRYEIQGSNLHKKMVIHEYYREGSEPHRFLLRLMNLPNENEIWRYHGEHIDLPEPVYKKLIELGTVIQQHRSLERHPRRPQTRSQTRRQALLWEIVARVTKCVRVAATYNLLHRCKKGAPVERGCQPINMNYLPEQLSNTRRVMKDIYKLNIRKKK